MYPLLNSVIVMGILINTQNFQLWSSSFFIYTTKGVKYIALSVGNVLEIFCGSFNCYTSSPHHIA